MPGIGSGVVHRYIMDDHRIPTEPVADLTVITLRRPVETAQGTVPAGATGTVVHVYQDGLAYIIEFYEPFHAVATVEGDAIAA